MFCRNCGKQLKEGASFCGHCGEKIVKKDAQPQTPAAQPSNPQSPPPPAPKPASALPQTTHIPPSAPNPQPQYPQQPYQNPQFRQGAAPVYSPAQPPQSRPNIALLIVIIVLLLLLLLIGSILLVIRLRLPRDPGGSNPGTAAVSTVTVTAETASAPVTTAAQTDSAPTSDSTAPDTSAADTAATVMEETEMEATEPVTEPPETEAADIPDFTQGLIGGDYNPMEDPWAVSTNERPRFEEFEWCSGQFGFIREAPPNAAYISDVQGYNGSWKAMIIYNPDDRSGYLMRELDNITISVDQNHMVQLTIDWYLLEQENSERINEEDMEDTVFSGAVTNTGLSVNGAALINIDNFWYDSERQYATGTITPPNGVTGYLAMVRP